MTIRFKCPNCSQLVEVDDEAAGMRVRCGYCNEQVYAPGHSPATRRAAQPQDVGPGRAGGGGGGGGGGSAFSAFMGFLSFLLSLLAFAGAAVALYLGHYRDPLTGYDFSTPKASLESRLRIDATNDVRARQELQGKLEGKRKREKLNTLQVNREATHGNYRFLFIFYKQDGKPHHEVISFDKDAETGYWVPQPQGRAEAEKDNPTLAGEMRDWEAGRVPIGGKEKDKADKDKSKKE
jgi:hypothetical protein